MIACRTASDAWQQHTAVRADELHASTACTMRTDLSVLSPKTLGTGLTFTARLVASARLPSAPMMSASMCSNQHFLAATMPSCARSSPAPGTIA
jgi:hypothetical protein